MADFMVFEDRFRDKKVFKTKEKALVFGAAETEKEFDILGNARVALITCKLPNFTNDVTGTLTVTNGDSVALYTLAEMARNSNHVITGLETKLLIVGTNTVKLTLSGVPGGTGGTASISVYLV